MVYECLLRCLLGRDQVRGIKDQYTMCEMSRGKGENEGGLASDRPRGDDGEGKRSSILLNCIRERNDGRMVGEGE